MIPYCSLAIWFCASSEQGQTMSGASIFCIPKSTTTANFVVNVVKFLIV